MTADFTNRKYDFLSISTHLHQRDLNMLSSKFFRQFKEVFYVIKKSVLSSISLMDMITKTSNIQSPAQDKSQPCT